MWPTPPCRSRVITSPFRTGGKTDSRSVRVDIWLCRLLGEEMKRFLLITVFFLFFFFRPCEARPSAGKRRWCDERRCEIIARQVAKQPDWGSIGESGSGAEPVKDCGHEISVKAVT